MQLYGIRTYPYLVRIPCGTFPALSLRTNAWLICSRSADSLVFVIEVSIAAMSQTGKPKQRDEKTYLLCCRSSEHHEHPVSRTLGCFNYQAT